MAAISTIIHSTWRLHTCRSKAGWSKNRMPALKIRLSKSLPMPSGNVSETSPSETLNICCLPSCCLECSFVRSSLSPGSAKQGLFLASRSFKSVVSSAVAIVSLHR